MSTNPISQSEYKGTPYEENTYEIVGNACESQSFEPLEVTVLETDRTHVDSMFADYGGIEKEKREKRWHLPKHVAEETEQQIKRKQDAAAVPMVSMTAVEFEAIKQQIAADSKSAAMAEAQVSNAATLDTVNGRMSGLIADLKQQLAEQVEQVEAQAVMLSIKIAKHIIDNAVEINPEYLVGIVKEAISQSQGAQIKRIRISPQDLEFINIMGLGKVLSTEEDNWNFEADPSIKSGCVVDTSSGQLDYQLEQAWERVKDNVVKLVRPK